MKINNKPEVNPKKTVTIKDKYKKYEYAFYLPIWVTTLEDKNKFRAFKYSFDIKPQIDFENLELSHEKIGQIKNSLSKEKSERNNNPCLTKIVCGLD